MSSKLNLTDDSNLDLDFNLGNGHIETYLEEIAVLNVRINKKSTLKPSFEDLPFCANFEDEEDYLNLVDEGTFHIILKKGGMLLDCRLDENIDFVDKNTDVFGYYSYSRL